MAKFNFRLQRVLNFRREQEEAAKTEYQRCLADRIEAEQLMAQKRIQRATVIVSSPTDLISRMALETHVCRLDDDENTFKTVIGILLDEETAARSRWLQSRVESESLQKLHDKAYDQWKYDEARKEQSALDEWAVLRR